MSVGQTPLSRLNELIYREPLPPPKELLRHITGTNKRKTLKPDVLRSHEQELYAKLYLYEKISKSPDADIMPDEAIDEIKQNRLECLILLLHYQLSNSYVNGAGFTARTVLDDDLPSLNDTSRNFLADQLIHLAVVYDESDALKSIEELIDGFTGDERLMRIVSLASLRSTYSGIQPQATITALRDMSRGEDEASVAAYYLLAQIYGQLKLPFEEMDCYSRWMIGLADVYKRSAAEFAGTICKRHPALEKTILQGATRWIHLLTASEKYPEVNKVVEEFKRAGYTEEMSLLKVNEARESGYQCKLITKDAVSNESKTRGLIYDLLLNSPRKDACLIVKDEHASDVERYHVAQGVAVDWEIVKSLPAIATKFSVGVIPDVVEENLLEARKWVLCYDIGNESSAIAVGIIPTGTYCSVVYSRAVVFDTQVNQQKDESWLRATAQLLGEPFDHQKLDGIRDAIRQIVQQLTPSRDDVQVIKV